MKTPAMLLLRLATLTGLLFAPVSLWSHEYWIEPHAFQVETGDVIVADLRNGQMFQGTEFAWFDSRIVRMDLLLDGETTAVTGRAGDVPAVRIDADSPGLAVLIHETRPQTVTYRESEKFMLFADHKGYGGIFSGENAAKLPEPPFEEGYRRLVKALVAVGHGKGADRNTGLETEFVALANPYTDTLPNGLPILLLYRQKPRANAQIEIFERSPQGGVSLTIAHTDAQGRAYVSVRSGHQYLLNSVVLRRPVPAAKFIWESLWAALTFARP